LTDMLTALQNQPFATAILEDGVYFPWIESTHVLAIVTVVGTICVVDLRLLGVKAHVSSAQRLMRQTGEIMKSSDRSKNWSPAVCSFSQASQRARGSRSPGRRQPRPVRSATA
ncbi:MAG: hypothetical protein ACXVW9_14040, partial [Nocardioidaceae bacterium]